MFVISQFFLLIVLKVCILTVDNFLPVCGGKPWPIILNQEHNFVDLGFLLILTLIYFLVCIFRCFDIY